MIRTKRSLISFNNNFEKKNYQILTFEHIKKNKKFDQILQLPKNRPKILITKARNFLTTKKSTKISNF